MKKWSDELIELSREYLKYDGTRVKSLKPEFGILNIDYENQIYTISILNSDRVLTFNSVVKLKENSITVSSAILGSIWHNCCITTSTL